MPHAPCTVLHVSGLFVMEPFRNIEFVTSLFVGADSEGEATLHLTHGSSDCEPRVAVYPTSRMRIDFPKYVVGGRYGNEVNKSKVSRSGRRKKKKDAHKTLRRLYSGLSDSSTSLTYSPPPPVTSSSNLHRM